MKSNKKFIIAMSAIAIIAVAAIVAVVGILAATSQNITSAISVKYTAQNVSATVSAKYYIGNRTGIDFTTDKTAEGEKEITFTASDTANKSLHPQGEVITLEVGEKLVFEYKFVNNADTTPIALSLVTSDLSVTNMTVTYGFVDSSLAVEQVVSTDNANTITSLAVGTTVIEGGSTKYAYIVMNVINESNDASFNGNFTWNMDRYEEGMELPEADLSGLVSSSNMTGTSVTLTSDDMSNFTGEILAIPSEINGTPVTTIAKGAFANDSDLQSISIPASVTSIGVSVFEACYNLTTIKVDSNNAVYESVNNCIIEKSTNTLVAGCNGSVIPNTVKIIGEGAFRGYSNSTITLPEGLEVIENKAFIGDKVLNSEGKEIAGPVDQLTSIVIPASVKTIGEYTFQYQDTLTSITFAQGSQLQEIKRYAFHRCYGLTNFTLPASVSTLGNYVFGSSGLTTFTIEDNSQLTRLPNYAFDSCKFTTFNWGENCKIETIGAYAFCGFEADTVTLPESVTSMEERVFQQAKIKTFVFPVNITYIKFEMFVDANLLETVTFGGDTSNWYKWNRYVNENSATKELVDFSTYGDNVLSFFTTYNMYNLRKSG